MSEKSKPTIRELEEILEGPGDQAVTLNPDGSVSVESDSFAEFERRLAKLDAEVEKQAEAIEKWSSTARLALQLDDQQKTDIKALRADRDRLEEIKKKYAWILNDMAYKAPEQLTAEFFIQCLDMLGQAIDAARTDEEQ